MSAKTSPKLLPSSIEDYILKGRYEDFDSYYLHRDMLILMAMLGIRSVPDYYQVLASLSPLEKDREAMGVFKTKSTRKT